MASTFLIRYSNEIQPVHFATYMEIHLHTLLYFYLIKAKLRTYLSSGKRSIFGPSFSRINCNHSCNRRFDHCLCNAMYSVNNGY